MPVFTDGASKSLVIECLLILNRTKQQTNTRPLPDPEFDIFDSSLPDAAG